MGLSRTPTQNTAGDGFPADPIDGYSRLARCLVVTFRCSVTVIAASAGVSALVRFSLKWRSRQIGVRPYEKAPFTVRTYKTPGPVEPRPPGATAGPPG